MSETITENNTFETRDIYLATFLKCQGCDLVSVIPLTPYRARFIFAGVTRELTDAYLTGNANAPTRDVVSEYRHLCKMTREGGFNG